MSDHKITGIRDFGLYDEAPEFARGFDAAMLWSRLINGERPVGYTLRGDLVSLAERMATCLGLYFQCEDAGHGFVRLTFTNLN